MKPGSVLSTGHVRALLLGREARPARPVARHRVRGGRTLTDVQFGRTADEAYLDTGRFRGALITLLDGLQRL